MLPTYRTTGGFTDASSPLFTRLGALPTTKQRRRLLRSLPLAALCSAILILGYEVGRRAKNSLEPSAGRPKVLPERCGERACAALRCAGSHACPPAATPRARRAAPAAPRLQAWYATTSMASLNVQHHSQQQQQQHAWQGASAAALGRRQLGQAGRARRRTFPAPHLRNLVLVACHSVYTGLDFRNSEEQSSWFLLDYQKVGLHREWGTCSVQPRWQHTLTQAGAPAAGCWWCGCWLLHGPAAGTAGGTRGLRASHGFVSLNIRPNSQPRRASLCAGEGADPQLHPTHTAGSGAGGGGPPGAAPVLGGQDAQVSRRSRAQCRAVPLSTQHSTALH